MNGPPRPSIQETEGDNASGGQAQLWFGDGLRLFVQPGGSLVTLDRVGTYDYSVHVSEAKAGAHNGEVVVD